MLFNGEVRQVVVENVLVDLKKLRKVKLVFKIKENIYVVFYEDIDVERVVRVVDVMMIEIVK